MGGRVLRFPRARARVQPRGLELFKLEAPRIPRGLAASFTEVQALEARVFEPLTVVEGPMGSRKTALLATWFTHTAKPAGWLSADPDDDDPVRFAVHFASAVQQAHPELVRDLNGLCALPASAEIEVVWAEQVVAPLRESGARVVVVVDDLHHALAAPRIVEAFDWLFARLPPGLSILASSERPLPFGQRFPALARPSQTDVDLPAALAVPDRLCPDLVRHLVAEPTVVPSEQRFTDGRDQWFQLPGATRSALRARLSTEEHRTTQEKLADWLLRHGQFRAAVRHRRAAGSSFDVSQWSEDLLSGGGARALVDLLVDAPPSEARSLADVWRLVCDGAYRSAWTIAPPGSEPEQAALRSMAALLFGRSSDARAALRGAASASPGSRASRIAGLVRASLYEGPDEPQREEAWLAAVADLLEGGHVELALHGAAARARRLVRAALLDEAKDTLQRARRWLEAFNLLGAPVEALIGLAEAELHSTRGQWREVVIAAGHALDVLDPLPEAPERARLAALLEEARANLPRETLPPTCEAPPAQDLLAGHRGVAEARSLPTATARLQVRAALLEHGVEAWWLAWPWRSGGRGISVVEGQPEERGD